MFKKYSSRYSWVVAPLLLVIVVSLTYFIDPLYFRLNLGKYSLHSGTRYYSRLRLWHYYVAHSQWSSADRLAHSLDPVDTAVAIAQNHPNALSTRVRTLLSLPNKSANDFVEMAKLYTRLGNTREALKALESALKVDPLRDDIRHLYRQLTQN
ncbi:MAG: hypothetical protein WCT01_02560 [Candidatus Shapirobacteria bacterium]